MAASEISCMPTEGNTIGVLKQKLKDRKAKQKPAAAREKVKQCLY